MAKSLDAASVEAIRADLATGMKINTVATKHNVSWTTVKALSVSNGNNPPPSNRAPKSTRGGRFNKAADSQETFAVQLTPAMLDAVWNTLDSQRKAQLLQKAFDAAE